MAPSSGSHPGIGNHFGFCRKGNQGMVGTPAVPLGVVSFLHSVLAAMASNHRGIQINGHFIQLQLGKPEPVNSRKELIVAFLVELLEEPAERALAGHPFFPAEYALDYLIMAKGSGMGKPGGS